MQDNIEGAKLRETVKQLPYVLLEQDIVQLEVFVWFNSYKMI